MPTVPRLATQQVQEQGANIRRTNIQGPQFKNDGGRSLAQVGQAAQQVLSTAIQIEDEARKKGNQLAVLEADQKLSSLETGLLYDRDSGAMNKKGKDAFGLPDQVFESYDKGSDEILNGLANEDQKDAFRRMIISRRGDIDKQLQRHISREGQKYDSEVTDSYIANERNAALQNFHDTNRVDLAVARQKSAILDHADRNGLPDEWVKLKTQEVQSKTHSGVINRIVDGGEDLQAKAYYEKYKDQLTGEDQQRVEKVLEAGLLRGESQRQSDQIWQTASEDLGTALDKAEKIRDPKLRDETVRRLRQKQANKDAAMKAREDNNFMTASEYVKDAPGVDPRDAMPPSKWEALTLQQQSALRKYNANPTNNSKVWLDFLDKNPAELANMSRAEFEQKFWVNFDSSHRTRAENMWKEASEGIDNPKLTNTLTFKDRVDNTLRGAKFVDPSKSKGKFSDKEAEIYNGFEQAAAQAVEQFERTELAGKRKATGQEVQKILDDMVVKKVFVDKNWLWSDPVKPAALITEDDKGSAYVPIKQVPQKDRNAIENLMTSKGRRVNKDKVERAYAAFLIGDRKLFDAIIGE